MHYQIRFDALFSSTDLCCRPPLPVLLSATGGQGLQISGQLTRREGKVFYNLKFENSGQTPLDTFMIQFNKNTFGLAAGGPLQVLILIRLFQSFCSLDDWPFLPFWILPYLFEVFVLVAKSFVSEP